MRLAIFIIFLISNIFAAEAYEYKWERGESFLTFLERKSLPLSLYYDLSKEDKELVEEIYSGVRIYELRSEDSGDIEQVLIPINDEMQIHLYKDIDSNFVFDLIPISYTSYIDSLAINIERSPYQDVLEVSGNMLLATEIVNAFKGSVDFRRDIQKGDKFALMFEQKVRLGKSFSIPKITASLLETNKKENYIFLHEDGRYYNEAGKEIENFLLKNPLNYTRISSKFSKKRWHPVLKKYRAHLGVDFAAPRGTPIKAAGRGKVSFVGNKGGYGKTVIIQHQDGYRTLYAHMKGYARGIKRGKTVKQGQTVGYVGNTGLSTGPHLHLGLYKNNRAIDPLKTVKVTTKTLNGDDKKRFDKLVSNYKNSLVDVIAKNSLPRKLEEMDYLVKFQNNNDREDKTK